MLMNCYYSEKLLLLKMKAKSLINDLKIIANMDM